MLTSYSPSGVPSALDAGQPWYASAVTTVAPGVTQYNPAPISPDIVPKYSVPAIIPPAPQPQSPTAGICMACQGTPQATPVLPNPIGTVTTANVPSPAAPTPPPATDTTAVLIAKIKSVPLWVWLVLGAVVLYKAAE